MLAIRILVVLISVASVIAEDGQKNSFQYDFSMKVRVLGWDKELRLFKISYRAGQDNALAIADINNGNLNIYEFSKDARMHFKIDKTSCIIIKISPDNLEKDPVFPIILTGDDQVLTDASSLLRVDGEVDSTSSNDFQNTETLKLLEDKEIQINENLALAKYNFKITYTRTKADTPEDQIPVNVRLESGDKVISYEIFDFIQEVSDDDFNVPDGYFCMPKEKDATPLPQFPLKTPSRLQFTKRGADESFRGWIDSRFGVRKEEAIDGEISVITDMTNNVLYTIDKRTGQCRIDTVKTSTVTPAEFLYTFDTNSTMQLLKEDVTVGTLKTFVLATPQGTNIFLTGRPGDESAIPLVVKTKLPGEFRESFIEGYTDEVDWNQFDVSQCLAPKSEDVFRIFFSIENNTAFGNPRDFQYRLLGSLMEWTGVKEPVRFINLQPYADGSISFTILPARGNSTEPKSLEVVQKLVALVHKGNAIVTRPDRAQSRIGPMTYETLGAPQATYRSIAVFWITFSVSIVSLFIGLSSAVIFIRRASPQNYIRRQLGV